ncbi:unnamed protein product [Trichobilharzia regenti]|nr:unnamed protein product [Trichobilharzia regenti]
MSSKVEKPDVSSWIQDIAKKRLNIATSVAEFKYAKCRVRQLKGPNHFPSIEDDFEKQTHETLSKSDHKLGVLYWMIREQRVQGKENFSLQVKFISVIRSSFNVLIHLFVEILFYDCRLCD